jgi:bifunctional DNA-binding transcriptional regulator/antitoxin component of YhaV-PrlF toxin-antitoxin module
MTLPKALRKALGVDKGGVVLASEEEGGIVLQPAAAFPIELYSDRRIAEFDAAEAELAKSMAEKRG